MRADRVTYRPAPRGPTSAIGLGRVLSLLLIVALALSACRAEPTPTFRIGTNVWPGYEPLFLARQLGYLTTAVRLVEYSSATEVISAFRNGAIEAAALTLDETLLLAQHEQAPRIVLVMDVSHGADAILGRTDVGSISAMKGRRVGVEHTAVGAYLLTRALQLNGLTWADLTIVPVHIDEHERAFRDGSVDAVVTFEPTRSRLRAAGARELFTSAHIPGEIMDVLAVRAHALERHRRELDTLLAGWFRALEYLNQHPREAAARIAPRMRLGPDEVLASYQGVTLPDAADNRALLAGATPQLLSTMNRLGAVMIDQKLLARPIDAASLLEPGPLLRIAP